MSRWILANNFLNFLFLSCRFRPPMDMNRVTKIIEKQRMPFAIFLGQINPRV